MRIFSNQWLQRILLFLFAVCFYASYENNFLEVFQGRDIRRALGLLQGHWIWHGPEILGGGTTPGPFYYWLLALPLAIFGKWQSLIWFEYCLAAASAVCLLEFGKKKFSPLAGWLMFFLFLNSSVIRISVAHFWNPSFVLIFQVLVLILMVDLKENKKIMLGAFLIGLVVQIHYTGLVFLLGAAFAIIFDSKTRISIRLLNLTKMFLAFALPLTPYLVWKLTLPRASTLQTESLGLELLFSFPKGSFQELASYCMNHIKGIYWNLSSWPSVPLGIALWGMLMGVLMVSPRKFKDFPRSKFLWFTFGVSALLSIKIIFSNTTLRYGIPFVLLVCVITSFVGVEVEKRFPRVFKSILGVVAGAWTISVLIENWNEFPSAIFQWQTLAMLSLSLAIFLGLNKKTKAVVGILLFTTFVAAEITLTKKEFHYFGFVNNLSERNRLAIALARTTGWTWEHFRERTYLVGVHPETDLSIMYEQALRENSATSEFSADGILIIHSLWGKFFPPSRELPAEPNWFAVKDQLPPEMFNAAKTQLLKCKKLERVRGFQICYYEFASQSKHLWNNLGYPYQYTEPQVSELNEPFAVTSSSPDQAVFYFNVCNNREPACTLYFKVKINPDKTLTIRAYGDPIGMAHGSFSPAWTAAIKNPQLEVLCGKTAQKYTIATYLGVPLDREEPYPRPFLLAPYETTFPLDCKKPSMISLLVSEEQPSHAIKLRYRQLLDNKRIEWIP